jgi:hypothetical protein
VTNADDFLMGGGGKSAKWPHLGYTVTGVVARQPEVRQQTEYVRGGGVGKPKFFDNGDPMNQLVVQLQTGERHPEDATDDGIRNAYIKGKQMTAVVREAILAGGAKGLQVGGTLSLTWVAGGPRFENDQEGPPKEWTAQYWPPQHAAANQFLGNNGGGQPAAQPGYQQPAYGQAPAAYQPQQPAYQQPAAQPAYAAPAPQGYAPPPQQQAYAAAPAPAPQPAYQPPLQQGPPRPPSVPEATWAGMDPNQQAAVAAAWATSPANTQPPF